MPDCLGQKPMNIVQFAALFVLCCPGMVLAAEDEAFFESKIRPVLVEKCYSCHSKKAPKVKGGLLLDSRAGFLKGGDSGPAIDLKEPAKSKILIALGYEDPELSMPPKGKLSSGVIKDVATWIASGAIWPGEQAGLGPQKDSFDLAKRKASHWVWTPLQATLSEKGNTSKALDPVDAYLTKARREKSIQATGPADPATLLRRLHVVLTGFGPKEANVQAFLADPSEANYRKEVDRLLDSWEHAEHFARHWLDLVRYGETRGHEFDYTIPNAWQYRDYVIRALKVDLPYNRLLEEHLAGDLLVKPRMRSGADSNESILGTGFCYLGEEIHSPVDIRQDEADRFDNRIDVVSKTFLGLTVACARCHDHKFDAISTKDYYGLYSVFESASYRQVRFEHKASNSALSNKWALQRGQLEQTIAKALAKKFKDVRAIDQNTFSKEGTLAGWLAGKDEAAPSNPVVDYSQNAGWYPDDLSFGAGPRAPGSLDLSGKNPGILPYGAACRDPLWTGMAPDPKAEKEPGALAYDRTGRTLKTPTFTVQSGAVWLWMRGQAKVYSSVGSHVMILGPLHGEMVTDSGASEAFRWVRLNLTRYIGLPCHLECTTDDPRFALATVFDQVAQPNNPGLAFFPKGQAVKNRPEHLKERLAYWLLHLEKQGTLFGLADHKWAALVLGLGMDSPEFAGANTLPEMSAWKALLADYLPKRQILSAVAPALWEGSQVTDHVFVRGSPKTAGMVVEPQNLEALGGALKGPGSRRLELATAWTNPLKTPMVPRVAINRIWHNLFGRGIVQSVDNLGVMGDAIQHQALLDQLALDFVQDGWSSRKMIKRLVLTQAWRQSSDALIESVNIDPSNNLIHHFRPKRMSGESIRDNLLLVSGRLSDSRFGPPTSPWINDFQEGRGRPNSGKLDEEGRRSIYVGVRRNFLSNWMLTFDTPIPFSTVGRRMESHVPAQSLILMNHPLVHDLCKSWGEKLALMPGDSLDRIRAMYLQAYGREATPEEVGLCHEFLKAQDGVAGPESWKALTHVLVNTREFVFLR